MRRRKEGRGGVNKFDPPEGRNARRFFDRLEGQGARRFFDCATVGRGSTTICTITGLGEQKSGVSRLHFARPPEGRGTSPNAEVAGWIPPKWHSENECPQNC